MGADMLLSGFPLVIDPEAQAVLAAADRDKHRPGGLVYLNRQTLGLAYLERAKKLDPTDLVENEWLLDRLHMDEDPDPADVLAGVIKAVDTVFRPTEHDRRWSRDLAFLGDTAGVMWLLSGGLSWGELPTEISSELEIIDAANLWEQPITKTDIETALNARQATPSGDSDD